MRDFVHGWRRKAGVGTLELACALLVMWFRSHLLTDQVWHGSDCSLSEDVRLGSSSGAIYWVRESVWWEKSISRKQMDNDWHWIAERPRNLGLRDQYRYSKRYWMPGAEIAATHQEQISKGGIRFAKLSYWRCSTCGSHSPSPFCPPT